MFRSEPLRDRAYLDLVKTWPCFLCGHDQGCDPAHVKFGCAEMGKPPSAGTKPGDCWVLPMCRKHHDGQHSYPGTERDFWQHHVGIEPRELLGICLALYRAKDDFGKGEEIVQLNRPKLAA